MLVSSAIAGLLWDRAGSSATLVAGAAFAALTLLGLAFVRTGNRRAANESRLGV